MKLKNLLLQCQGIRNVVNEGLMSDGTGKHLIDQLITIYHSN